jgi:hypothetical protein
MDTKFARDFQGVNRIVFSMYTNIAPTGYNIDERNGEQATHKRCPAWFQVVEADALLLGKPGAKAFETRYFLGANVVYQ